MNTPPDSTQPIAGDDKLVFEFFATFSRFECALKRAGFVKEAQWGNASAAWNKFADTLNGKLAAITDADFISAKSFLLLKRPRQQMLVAGRMQIQSARENPIRSSNQERNQ